MSQISVTCDSFTSQNSKTHALIKLFVALHSDIYNQKESFNFHLTFLQLNVIKMVTVP